MILIILLVNYIQLRKMVGPDPKFWWGSRLISLLGVNSVVGVCLYE